MSDDVVILSGGLDSTVCLALSAREGRTVALTFDYGQRQRPELQAAERVAVHYGVEQIVVPLDARPWGGSALTDSSIEVPRASTSRSDVAPTTGAARRKRPTTSSETASPIPVTYVPARNLIFLSVALGVAEAGNLDAVHLGVNALDYSGYPDCRPEFVDAFRRVAALAQRRGVEGRPVLVETPLIDLHKSEIVELAVELDVPLELTWSCYREGPAPCGTCDACALRAKGFERAGVIDPAVPRQTRPGRAGPGTS
jgi:7-cyano-7-deazaguanine synthase